MSSVLGTSLSTPAPTPGSIRRGQIPLSNVASRKRSLPTVASMQNPSIHNSVTELQTNSTAAVPLFCRPYTNGYEKEYDEGDILFVKKEDMNTSAKRQSPMHVVANVPVLNHLLRTTKNVSKEGAVGGRKYRTVDDFLKDWNFFGVMLNDMDGGSRYQRLLNVTVRGRCRVGNLWSTDAGRQFGNKQIQKGQTLWLGIRYKRHKSAEIVLTPSGGKELEQATDDTIEGRESYLEVVPVLEGESEFSECVHAIPIAIVHHMPFKNTPRKRQYTARYVSEQGKLLERMEVFVRV